jgi:hypothetical protein
LKRQKIGHNNNTTDAADAIATLFGANSAEKTEDAPEEQKHFNLFPELEAKENGEVLDLSRTSKHTNPEHEAEERAKQERLNRQFTTYLGQSSSEYTKNKPWYEGGTSEISEAKQQRMERRKSEADPLSAMNKYMTVKSTSDTLTRPSYQQLAVVRAQLDSTRQERAKEEKARAATRESKSEGENKDALEADKEKQHKDKKDKDKKHKKDKRKDKKDKDKKDKKKEDTLERLRRERIARENEERAQLQRLVQGPGAQSRGPSRGGHHQYQPRAHHNTGTRVERGGERMREDY